MTRATSDYVIEGLGEVLLAADPSSGALPCRIVASGGARLSPDHRVEIDALVRVHGAVRLEGFGIKDAATFASGAAAVAGTLSPDAQEHPLVDGHGAIYSATPYPARLPILAHNENSHLPQWPERIIFGCLKPAVRGGTTTLADCELALDRAPRPLVEALMLWGIEYQRVLGGGMGLDWRSFFGVDSRDAAEAACVAQGYAFHWLDSARLRLSWRRPAIAQHPDTGRPVWFNQITHFHPDLLPDGMGERLRTMFVDDELPRTCRLGNGAPILAADAYSVAALFESLAFGETWDVDQMLVVDNVRLAHGRMPYEGDRRMLVAISDVQS